MCVLSTSKSVMFICIQHSTMCRHNLCQMCLVTMVTCVLSMPIDFYLLLFYFKICLFLPIDHLFFCSVQAQTLLLLQKRVMLIYMIIKVVDLFLVCRSLAHVIICNVSCAPIVYKTQAWCNFHDALELLQLTCIIIYLYILCQYM